MLAAGVLWTDRVLDAVRFPSDWPRDWARGAIAAAATVVLAWLLSRLAAWLIGRTMRKVAARTPSALDDKILAVAEGPLSRLILVGGLYFAVGALPLPARIQQLATGIVYIAAVIVTVRLVSRVLLIVVAAYGRRMQDSGGQVQFEKDYLPLVAKALSVVLAVMGLIAVLNHFDQEVSSLVAALGVSGVALSLAAKDILGNMMAGFAILVDRPFRPSDRIRLATGEVGDVVEVGTRSTRVLLLDQNMLIVPNSELVNSRVVNLSYPSHATRAEVLVGVAYGSDVEKAKRVVLEAIRAQPEVPADPPPFVHLASFGDSALNIGGSYVVAAPENAVAVQDRVRVEVYRRFMAEGVKIPFPTREIVQAASIPAERRPAAQASAE